MSRYSLQTLVDVCKHPIFGNCVTDVSLSMNRACPEGIDEPLRAYKESFAGGDPEDLDNSHRILQSYMNECHEENMLEKSGEGTRLITAALTLLKQRSRPVHLTLTDEFNDQKTIGHKKAYGERGLQRNLKFKTHLKTSIRILANAAFRSGCNIDGLSIFHECTDDCRNKNSECRIDLGTKVLGAFKSLKTLNIRLERQHSDEDDSLGSLRSILQSNTKLEKLQLFLGCFPDEDEERLTKAEVRMADTLLHQSFFRSLKQLKLHNLPIPQKTLIMMVKKSRRRLQTLHLDNVSIRRGSWGPVMAWMCDNLNLEEIYFGYLFEIDDDDLNADGCLTSEWNEYDFGEYIRGVDEIKSFLRMLL